MHRARIVAGVTLMYLLLAPSVGAAAEPYAVVFEANVPVKMRDGVTLRADIYRPACRGSLPVLLQRTPYNKDGDHGFGLKAAARGYIVVVQDVRGRYASEGEWYTFKHEVERRVRHGGVGRGPAACGRQGGHVRRLVRRRDADARGDRPSSAPRGHLSSCDGQQLPRELDLPGRRLPAVVQPVVDLWPRARHVRAPDRRTQQRHEGRVATPARHLPAVQPAGRRKDPGCDGNARPVLSRLARASERGRLLETVVD